MQLNRANLTDMFRGYSLIFQNALAAAPSMYERIAMTVPSTSAEETYAWMNNLPGMRKWVGDRVIQNISTSRYSIVNEPFELTVEVKRNDIEDDKFGLYNPLVQSIGFESKTHPDQLVYGALAKADSSRCWDGQYFFDTDHPLVAADGSMATYSNFGGGAGDLWVLADMSRPIKPLLFQKRRDYAFAALMEPTQEAVFMRGAFVMGTDARVNVGYGLPQLAYGSRQQLTAAAFEAARASMQSLKGDQGKVLAIKPTILMVSPNNEGPARRILQAEMVNGGDSNINRGLAEIVVVPWLAA